MLRSQTSACGRRRLRRAGFTLLEILIVIALIGALVALTVGNLGGIFGQNQEEVARIFVTNSMKVPLTQYRIHMGNYPTSEQGLKALATAPDSAGSKWKGPYIEGKVPNDPWENPYQYKYPGEKNAGGARGYDLWSNGPDGQPNTADDIGNWE